MCGIAGILTTNYSLNTVDLAQQLIQQLHHRGPDAHAVQKADALCSLAHTRLKIIDLSDSANQPMYCYQKRLCIVFNGEIYNYKSLKLELQRATYSSTSKPYPFCTQSDTEVILAAYYRWGKDCVKYLDGMFAFAIYDTHTQEIFLARDRQGKKPLYYTYQPKMLAFASEIRPLLQSSFSNKKLNYSQLYDYFQYQTTFTPHTLIQDIYLLEASSSLTISITPEHSIQLNKQKYWNPIDKIYTEKDLHYEEAKQQVRHLLFQAVEKRLISDVPLGAFLSGGMDSSAIVSIMKQVSHAPVDVFHVSTQTKEFAENNYAQQLSKRYQTRYHHLVLHEKDVLQLVSEALQNIDYPSGDGINTYIVSKATKKAGITVALSGLGGDELFAGYPQFKILYHLHRLKYIDFPAIRKILSQCLPPHLTHSAYRLKILMQADSLNLYSLFPYYRHLFSKSNIPLQKHTHTSFFHTHSSEKHLLQNHHRLSFISLSEMDNYMQSILLRDTDQMSMAQALEVRAPFLDTALVSFVLALPDAYKYPHTPKKLLSDALQDLLPEDILYRKKMGFVLPFKNWMRKELKSFCNEKIQRLSPYTFVNTTLLQKEWQDYQNKKHDYWWMFWHLIVLQHWIETHHIRVE